MDEIKNKYGIELIGKGMWVWDDDISKAKLKMSVTGKTTNASDINPNEPKQPKVGDVGYFWSLDIKKGYTYGKLKRINSNHWPFVCDSGVSFTHFSHEKQPWMK